MLAQLSRAAARTAPVVRRAPLRCLSAVRAIDPSTTVETIAAVPGFVGAMFRHFKALRTMERDGGWTNLLLEEAENEKM